MYQDDAHAAHAIWQSTLRRLETRVQRINFSAFIQPLVPLHLSDNALVLQSLDPHLAEQVATNYGRIIEETLTELCGYHVPVRIVTSEGGYESGATFPVEGGSGDDHSMTASAPSPGKLNAPALVERSRENSYNQLNPRYTFDRFISGKSNALSLTAAQAVAEAPGKAYNPLFIYGDVGLGKTHLLHAIGHCLLDRFPHYRALYVPFIEFLNEFIVAIRNNSTETFRNRYREVDLLLVDDIQFIESKESTQEEFFHTFNSLYLSHKQIILASDRHPRDIPVLADRVRSRFDAGLNVEIEKPDLETRIAILQSKAHEELINCASEVFSYIAARISSNIRELEGALMRLKARAGMDQVPLITLDYAALCLKDVIRANNTRIITVELIQQVVAGFFGVTIEDLKSKRRTQDVTLPRQVAMFFCRELTDQSLPKIGDFFGNRDHATVLHAVRTIQAKQESDPTLSSQLLELRRQIQA